MVRQLGKEYVEGQLQVFEQEMQSMNSDATLTHLKVTRLRMSSRVACVCVSCHEIILGLSQDILGFCLSQDNLSTGTHVLA